MLIGHAQLTWLYSKRGLLMLNSLYIASHVAWSGMCIVLPQGAVLLRSMASLAESFGYHVSGL